VTAVRIKHSVPCYGFIVQQQPRWSFDVEKFRSMGGVVGPDIGRIKSGESIQLPNGDMAHPSDFVAEVKGGKKFVILGDTCDPAAIAPYAKDADLLVHEATLPDAMQKEAISRGHSTPAMAGIFASEINAKHLALTHFSARDDLNAKQHSDLDPAVSAHAHYRGPIIPAVDFMFIDWIRH